MLKEIARPKAQIKETADEDKRSDLTRLLHKKSLALTIALEKYKRKR
jgi:hypothetical protein